MPTTKIFYLHSIVAADLSFALTQLSDLTPNHNFDDLSEKAASQVGPQFTGTEQAKPDINFKTSQLLALLTEAAAGDFNVAIDLSALSMQLEYRRGEAFGTRDDKANATHVYAQANYNSMLVVESISGKQGGRLEAKCRFLAVQTSTDDPLVFSKNVALSAVGIVEAFYTIGPVKLNGTFMQGVQDWTLDNNCEYEIILSEGDGFPSYVGVKSIKPRLTVHTRDTSNIQIYGNKGTALTSLSLFGRKKLKSGINVADATAQHLKFVATDGTIKSQQVQGDDSMAEVTVDLAQATVTIDEVTNNEDSDPYTISTGSAIA